MASMLHVPCVEAEQPMSNKLSLNDKVELSHGFDRGNYANAYETTDYEVAKEKIKGSSAYYYIGHLLGFFSTYEDDEVPEQWRNKVCQTREQYEHFV